MKNDFYSYLDGFNRVTIIYPKDRLFNKHNKNFYMLVEHEKIELSIKEMYDLGREVKYICVIPESLHLNVEYAVVDERNNRSELRTGAIVWNDLFEMLYYYNRDDLDRICEILETIEKYYTPDNN